MKRCMILANGQPPKKRDFDFITKNGFNHLFCADGGANSAVKFNIIPDCIIGDLDSIRPEVYDYYFDKCEIIKIDRQNDTDVEKCIKHAIKYGFDEVLLLGATGDRLDHSFCNLGLVFKYFEHISIKILHQRSLLAAFSGKVHLNTLSGETISLYGKDSRTRVKSTGLKYPLKNISLPFGKRESTSNVALGKSVELKISGGIIFVIRDFGIMKNNDLF
ncbi:MAG: thiamine diphosphokinase [Ignavibacteriae bacterium HGW-Ignavibacteriae-3]|nr:MAG: thiamine diphosphokinase [Ignavibacteriae bacterium HGW-Ignavibacteriae-3]